MKFGRQYAAKVAANVVNLLVGMVILGLVPRALGPEGYGRYEFLANFFQQVKGFLDMGTSACFYTRLSQRQDDFGLVIFYRRLLLGVSMLMIVGSLFLAEMPVGRWLWAGEKGVLVGLAAFYIAVMWWMETLRKMVDAWHLTVWGEMFYASSRVVAVLILVAVVWMWGLRLEGYFVYQIVASLLAIVLLTCLLNKQPSASRNETASLQPTSRYLQEFWDYSHPLVVYAGVGVMVGLADRWILQTKAGAVEQGFFGFASQVGALCFLFTGAMTQLLTREFAVAWNQRNMDRMRSMFRRIVPMLYALAAYFSIFIANHAQEVALLLGGQAWKQGALVMSIMVLYPMHQTYGQLSGSVFYATGQTRLYRNIGIAGMVTGLPVMLWLVMPTESGGFGLGAAGLALKMVLLQFVFVNIGLWFNARLLSLNFWMFLAHQLVVPIVFLACVLVSSALVSLLELSRLYKFLAAGAGYTFLVGGMILLVPQLAGLQRGEIWAFLRKVPSLR